MIKRRAAAKPAIWPEFPYSSFPLVTGDGFFLAFPVRGYKLAQSIKPVANPAGIASMSDQRPERPLRVLVVDDVEIHQDIAKAAIASTGRIVDVASDGYAAIDAVGRVLYDIIFMDVQMPKMDGITATRRIRALPGIESRIPIIALSGTTLSSQVAMLIDAGMNDHVGKPFEPEDLRDAVDRWATSPGADRWYPENLAIEEFESATFDQLADLVGPQRVRQHLVALSLGLEALTIPLQQSQSELGAVARAMATQAGSLGFSGLSAFCKTLERIIASREPVEDHRLFIDRHADKIRGIISQLLSREPPPGSPASLRVESARH
jgi:CheY-like chemotaxis protein